MFSRIGLACFVLLAASLASAHDDPRLDPRNGTLGLRLEMTALPRASAAAPVRYRLHGVGFPRGVIFSVWTQDFGQPFRAVAFGFEVDESGNLVSSKHDERDRANDPNQITFGPGPYPWGVAWRVALISVDRTLRAFAAVIPHPITARDGPCTISLE